MDRTDAQSIIANSIDVATWCAARADELDGIRINAAGRPWSPREQDRIAEIQIETLRRVSQNQTMTITVVFHHAAPWWVWWRAWWWRFTESKKQPPHSL